MFLSRKKLAYDKASDGLYGKPKPKKFNYSSEKNATIIESALANIAAARECSISDVIEDILIDSVIPADPYAAHYVSNVLYGRQFNADGTSVKYGIREALEDIFATESMGSSWKARHDNNKPLVNFAKDLLMENGSTLRPNCFSAANQASESMHSLLDSWDSVCHSLEDCVRQRKANNLSTFDYEKEAKYAREIERALHTDASFKLFNTFVFILQNWSLLGQLTHTFRFMSTAIALSIDWTDSRIEQFRFSSVCQEVMNGWTLAETAEKIAAEENLTDETHVSYQMANGDILKAPREWLVANPERGIFSKYAGVIEIKNGEAYEAPHILFFSDIPVDNNFDSKREAEVLNAATSIWPRLSEVLADEIELKYRSDGGVANMKDYASSPHIGLFNIFEEDCYPFGKPPYGTYIVRAQKNAE